MATPLDRLVNLFDHGVLLFDHGVLLVTVAISSFVTAEALSLVTGAVPS